MTNPTHSWYVEDLDLLFKILCNYWATHFYEIEDNEKLTLSHLIHVIETLQDQKGGSIVISPSPSMFDD
jgi:hypothetical protein